MTLGHGMDRMAVMLSRLGGWGYSVEEERAINRTNEIDPDSDPDETIFQPDHGGNA